MAHIDINFISNALSRAVDITLILPTKTSPTLESNYDAKTNTYYQNKKNKKYPLLILLHGLLNDEKNWTRYARAEMYAEENNIAIALISAENKFYLNWDSCFTKDSFYDFIEYELKDFLYGTFPISKKREDNFIAGLSMGGFGALYHGFSNPKAYAKIGAFSPAAHYLEDQGKGLTSLLKKKKNLPEIYMSIGDKDFLLESNKELVSFLTKKGIPYTFEIIPGYDHEWRLWDMELEKFIKSLNRTDEYVKETPRGV